MRYAAGKCLELIGLVIVFAALLAGLGLTSDGQASMGKEMLLLGVGGMVFTLGWMIERGSQA
ncbi:MAG TPA: hypothetical protein VEK08_13225 [Planctomycetota bacterium]|nr:hypothetical protein [Planctomycetota bacterium]